MLSRQQTDFFNGIGALPTLYAAASAQAAAGGYYGPNGALELRGLPGWAAIPEAADDPEVSARLWAALEQLAGGRFGQTD
ncbi:MAG: hypothetical protein ACN4EU_03725 [Brevundimonas mediterranea]